jgi:hypothetical protein
MKMRRDDRPRVAAWLMGRRKQERPTLEVFENSFCCVPLASNHDLMEGLVPGPELG